MPLRRMNAITTSIASADSISARSWCPTAGSPGRVGEQRRVEQRDERSLDRLWPSVGKTRPAARPIRARGRQVRRRADHSFPSVSARRCRISPAAMRAASALRCPSGARSIALASMPARWRDTRSDASASRSSARSASSVPSGISSSSASSLRVSSASCSPGLRVSLVNPLEFSSRPSSAPGRTTSREFERENPANRRKPSDGLEPSTPSLPWRCSTN